MNDNTNIDKQIREKLDGFSVAPPPHVWNNIQGQMAAQRKKRRIAYIAWAAAAAVIVFAFVGGWLLNDQTSNILPELVQQEVKKQGASPVKVTTKKEESILKPRIAEAEKIAKQEAEKPVVAAIAVNEELENENTFVASIEKVSYEFLARIEAVFESGHFHDDLVVRKEEQISVSELTTNDAILMAANAQNFQKTKTKENGWIVGAHVSPGYSSHSANHGEQYTQNMTYSGENGVGNVGGGMSVQYKTSKRLRIESGVYYSQNGQSSANSRNGLFNFGGERDLMYASPENISDANMDGSFSNVVELANDGIAMNSTAGVIKMRSTPKGASVATNAEVIGEKYANTLTTNGEFSQVFEFVEVPLYLRYSILDKKFGIELMGGINAGFVVGNNAYIDNDYGKQNIGSTEDISTLNISGTVGVGMNYALGKNFSLAFEPRLNYYLNSINTNPDVDYRPYRVGFFTGVYYEF